MRQFWAYNLKILLSQSVWVVIVPVAATQLLTLWGMATASLFQPWTPVQAVELLAPMVAAFLTAHTLGSEYRYRAEEVLLCKPLGMGRVLGVRLCLLYGFLGLLMAAMLLTFHFGLQRLDFWLLVRAGLPSILFLSLLSLGMAALFRSPMMGWLLAGLYWALDLVGGVQFHPLFTLQACTASLRHQPFGEWWPWSKGLLLLAAAVLFGLNVRWLRWPEGLHLKRQRLRAYLLLGLALAVYFLSGVFLKIHYGLRHEAELGRRAWTWYRLQFAVYRGLPVARLAGPAFAAYVSQPPPQRDVAKVRRAEMAALQRVVEHYPQSLWADNALLALAQLRRDESREEALETYQRLAREYPSSPFAPIALREAAELLEALGRTEEAFRHWEELLQRFPASLEIWPAVSLYAAEAWRRGQEAQAVELMGRAAAQSSPLLRGLVRVVRAELLWRQGRRGEAQEEARRALPDLQAGVEATQAIDISPMLMTLRQPLRTALAIARELAAGTSPTATLLGPEE